jgi:hypothetical protein
MMTNAGRPLSRPALLSIENRSRGLSLDEALGLANVLRSALANLLSPPEGSVVALTEKEAVDAEGLRNWLLAGVGFVVWPASPTDEDRTTLRVWLDSALERHAFALADAVRSDDKAGIFAAGKAIVETVREYDQAAASINDERSDRA